MLYLTADTELYHKIETYENSMIFISKVLVLDSTFLISTSDHLDSICFIFKYWIRNALSVNISSFVSFTTVFSIDDLVF